jgi:ribosomal protein L5
VDLETAQNTNILKKILKNLKIRTKASYYKIKKSTIAGFKIREDMELGLTVTTLEEKNVCLLTILYICSNS